MEKLYAAVVVISFITFTVLWVNGPGDEENERDWMGRLRGSVAGPLLQSKNGAPSISK